MQRHPSKSDPMSTRKAVSSWGLRLLGAGTQQGSLGLALSSDEASSPIGHLLLMFIYRTSSAL